MENLKKERDSLKSYESLIKAQLAVALQKIKKLEECVVLLEAKNKNGND